MGLFGKKKAVEEEQGNGIDNYLLEGEEIKTQYTLVDTAVLTNKRLIFKDINLSLTDNVLEERVYLPLSKIDSVAIKKKKGALGGNELIIRAGGFAHSINIGKEDEELINFVKEVSNAIV